MAIAHSVSMSRKKALLSSSAPPLIEWKKRG
jgi:hypothetical protein